MEATMSQRMRQAREVAGKGQAEAARELGIDQSTLSRLENAQTTMNMSVAERYAEVLKIDPLVLFLGHTLEVIERAEERGLMTPADVAAKTTRLLGMAHARGEITDEQLRRFITSGQRLVEKARTAAECKAAGTHRRAGDLIGAVR
jgi:transcriptional regulator with XRE-family HTH domain